MILGFPADDVAHQEPRSDDQIAEFCKENFGVSFPMFAKSNLVSDPVNPVFAELNAAAGPPSWNFNKYLLDRDGEVVEHYDAGTAPDDPALSAKLDQLLAASSPATVGPDQDLVDVDARGLAERVDDRAGDVVVVEGVVGPGAVVEERRVDHPGLDQGDPDRVVVVHLAQLLAQRLADRGHRPLGRRVHRARQGPAPGDRAGDQEVAGVALEQVGEGGADRQRDAEHVGQHHLPPLLGRLLEKAAGGAEAGVGEDGVEAAEGLDRGGGERLVVAPTR